jgi:hypothetical protein
VVNDYTVEVTKKCFTINRVEKNFLLYLTNGRNLMMKVEKKETLKDDEKDGDNGKKKRNPKYILC